ncbi:MAG TPA: hypothetical protein VK586_14430 [Streptosporangiaceae bacterium]|nr:hypothetical protein [Streptosporangiaceae bacterium]
MARHKQGLAKPTVARKPSQAPIISTSARQKTLPVPRRGLPDAGSSEERLCWRFRHADHDGRWCLHTAGDNLRDILEELAKFESMTVGEVFSGGGYPGKDYDVESIPPRRRYIASMRLAWRT